MGFPFVDLVIAGVVIVAILLGVKEGFFKSIIGLGGIAVSLVGAYFLSGLLVQGLDAAFGVKDAFAGVFEKLLLDSDVLSQDGNGKLFAMILRDKNMAGETITHGLQALKMPEVISSFISSSVIGDLDSYDYSSNITLAKMLSPAIAGIVLTIIALIVIFIIIKILLGIISRRLLRKRKATPVVAVDRVLGVASGFIKAMIFVVVALTVVALAFPSENFVTIGIQNSMAGKFLYEHNPLPEIIIRYI